MPTVDINKETKISHIHKTIRRQRHPALFIGLSDELINQSTFRVSEDLEIRFKAVFSPEQRENTKIVMHPMFMRPTIYEKTWHKGQPLWHPVCMFQENTVEGHLPNDIKNRWGKGAEHMRGKVGDLREVTYQDLEFVERCDVRKYGVIGVCDFISQFDTLEADESTRVFEDFTQDYLDYNFWDEMRNCQAHYSKPWSTREVQLKSDPSRYKVVDMGGWKMRERIYGEEGDINEFRAFMGGDEHFDSSASGKAATRILELKNEKYFRTHGKSLWEVVTESSELENLEDSIAFDAENKRQASSLFEMAKSSEKEHAAGQTVEEFLLSLKP